MQNHYTIVNTNIGSFLYMKGYFEILGCGSSLGTPIIGCNCQTCTSADPKNKRLRSSARFILESGNILIDTTPDLRQQALRANFSSMQAIIFTHSHADHIMGFEDLRSFYVANKSSVNCYATSETCAEIKKIFHYIFEPVSTYLGVVPKVAMHEFLAGSILKIDNLKIQSIPILHGGVNVCGFRLGNLCYCTDIKNFPAESKPLVKGCQHLILGAIGEFDHHAHLSVNEAIELAKELEVKNLYLTHLGHSVEYHDVSQRLPSFAKLCFDGLKIEFDY